MTIKLIFSVPLNNKMLFNCQEEICYNKQTFLFWGRSLNNCVEAEENIHRAKCKQFSTFKTKSEYFAETLYLKGIHVILLAEHWDFGLDIQNILQTLKTFTTENLLNTTKCLPGFPILTH